MKYLPLILLLILWSCIDSHGHQVRGGDLTVHYENKDDDSLAMDLVRFWKSNDLIANGKQDVKLSRSESGYYVMLITKDKSRLNSMDFNERRLLVGLQSMLEDSVFNGRSVELIICDDHFKELMNINE